MDFLRNILLLHPLIDIFIENKEKEKILSNEKIEFKYLI